MIKVTPGLFVKGDLFPEYGEVKDLPFLYQPLRKEIQDLLTLTLSTATALNIIVRVGVNGIDLIDNTNNAVGVFTVLNEATKKYVMASNAAFSTFAIAAEYAAAANIVEAAFMNLFKRQLQGRVFGDDPEPAELTTTQPTTLTGVTVTAANVKALGAHNITLGIVEGSNQPVNATGIVLSNPSTSVGTYTLTYTARSIGALTLVTGVTITDVQGVNATGNIVSTAFTAGAITNVTGVTITNVKGINGSGTIAFVKASNTLAFGGGTAVATPANGSYELTNLAGTTTIVVTVVFASLPVGNQTSGSVAVTVPTLSFGGGTAVSIPGNGNYTLINAATTTSLLVTVLTASLANVNRTDSTVAFVVPKLKLGTGSDVVIGANGAFTLTAQDAVTIVATVTYASLAAANKTDSIVLAGASPTLKFKTGTAIAVPADGSYILPFVYESATVTVDVSALPAVDTVNSITVTTGKDINGNQLLSIGNLS